MTLQDRIINYVTKCNGLVSLDKLVLVASSVGFSESEVLQALERIGKKLKSTVRGNQIYYQPAPPPKTPVDRLKWVRENYPIMTSDNDGSGLDLELGWMFLKTKEERDAFLLELKGRTFVNNSKLWKR